MWGGGPLRMASVLLLMATAVPALAQSDNIPDAMKPIAAVTRIFALENHFNGDLNVFDEDEGHIGQEFEVNHEPGQKCAMPQAECPQTSSFRQFPLSRRL